MERVKSADVLDPTHEAKRPFRAALVGYFERTGPNAWDDYCFIRSTVLAGLSSAGESCNADGAKSTSNLTVLPGLPLQLESRGVEVRMRAAGRVVRVRWIAEPADVEAIGAGAEPRVVRRYFTEHCLVPLGSDTGLGAAAVMVRKLNR